MGVLGWGVRQGSLLKNKFPKPLTLHNLGRNAIPSFVRFLGLGGLGCGGLAIDLLSCFFLFSKLYSLKIYEPLIGKVMQIQIESFIFFSVNLSGRKT